jgi:hypothetical protein
MQQIKGFIRIYSRQARDQIIQMGKKFLARNGLEVLADELFACVDELIKNAVKSNYKFLLLRERIWEQLRQLWPEKSPDEIEEDINDLIKIPESYNRIAEEILKSHDISGIVREILNEESKLLTIKNTAYLEKRDYTSREREIISGLNKISGIRKKIKERNIKIMLRIHADNDFIYIDVTNTAPILTRDINRIHEKRDEHRRYRDERREHEFFIDNIDTSESGFGLGYAKIDAILNDWGITDMMAITIISAINTTVMMILPVDKLREHFNV